MKKINLALLLFVVVFGCTACALDLSITTKEDVEKPAEIQQETVEKETESAPEKNDSNAFYGVWCSGSKDRAGAENFAAEMMNAGFDAKVFVTTDWENLNPEKFYVVTAGMCKTKQAAEELLETVKKSGYSDAYVKYSGERK